RITQLTRFRPIDSSFAIPKERWRGRGLPLRTAPRSPLRPSALLVDSRDLGLGLVAQLLGVVALWSLIAVRPVLGLGQGGVEFLAFGLGDHVVVALQERQVEACIAPRLAPRPGDRGLGDSEAQ